MSTSQQMKIRSGYGLQRLRRQHNDQDDNDKVEDMLQSK